MQEVTHEQAKMPPNRMRQAKEKARLKGWGTLWCGS